LRYGSRRTKENLNRLLIFTRLYLLLTILPAIVTVNAVIAPPANDRFSEASIILGSTVQLAGSNREATRETGEPNHAEERSWTSVWWKWTAPAKGTVRIKTDGSDFDTLLAVYTGASLSNLIQIASNDDSGAGGASFVTFEASAGTSYHIAVDGVGGESGSVALSVILQPIIVFPKSLSIIAPLSAPAINQSLSITADGAIKNWSVAEEIPWLSLSASSGTTPAAVTVSYNISGLTPGLYTNVLTFNSEGVSFTVPVRLELIPNCIKSPAGLAGWWPWDGSPQDVQSKLATDLFGNPSFVAGKVGQALQLNGTGQFAKVGSSQALDVGAVEGFSLEAWIKPDDITAERPLLEWNNGQKLGVHLWINVGQPGSLVANIVDPQSLFRVVASPGGVIKPNEFQHVALTYDKGSGSAELFLNGRSVGKAALGRFTPATSYDLYVGYRPAYGAWWGPAVAFKGVIDEVGVYSRALTPAEVLTTYNATISGACGVESTPANGETARLPLDRLSWTAGQSGVRYDVYLGTSQIDVANATIHSAQYFGSTTNPFFALPAPLESNKSYFWRVDFIEAAGTRLGEVWTFRTTPLAVNPKSLAASATVGETPANQSLAIAADGAARSWALAEDTPWLSLSANSGTTPATVTIAYNVGGMSPGLYTNRLVLSSEGLSFDVPVRLELIPSCVKSPPGLVSSWPWDGSGQDVRGTDAAELFGPPSFVTGKVRQALQLNGNGQYAQIRASASLNVGTLEGFTIEAWIKPDDLAAQQPLWEWSDGGKMGAHLWINVGKAGNLMANLIDLQGAYHVVTSDAPVMVVNTFQHVALTFVKATGTAELWHNGRSAGKTPLGSFTPATLGHLYVGHRPQGQFGAYYYRGAIDEMGLYNRALNPVELQAIFNAGVAGKCAIPAPPFVTAQPISQTVSAGSNATLSVFATGLEPLSYQWRKDGIDLPGATAASLVLANVQASDTGNYTVMVSNVAGSAISAAAMLRVVAPNFPPTISNIPDQTIVANTPTPAIVFAVGDKETAAGSLLISAASTNETLIPRTNVFIGGSGADRTVTVTPRSGQTGTGLVRLIVTDQGGLSASNSFKVTVLPAGLQLSAGAGSGVKGSQVVIPVRANGLTNLADFQFSAHWDSRVARFVNVEQFGLPGLGEANFGVTDVGNGTLRVSWDDVSGTGTRLENGTTIFALRFELIAEAGLSAVQLDGMPLALEAHVTEAGQFKAVPIYTQDGQIRIQDTVPVGGTMIYYSGDRTVPGVVVNITGDETRSVMAQDNGAFNLTLNAGGNYTISPAKETESPASQGVTTLDLTLVRRHLLDMAALDSPYKILAADVNDSGSVSTLDITLMRRLILGSTNPLPAGLWRFVRSDFGFSNPQAPWVFERTRTLRGITNATLGQSFLGIKLGDVNASWSPANPAQQNLAAGASAQAPTSKLAASTQPVVAFTVSSEQWEPGGTNEVLLTVAGFKGVTTAQFTLQWDPDVLQFIETRDYALEGLADGNFSPAYSGAGKLTFSWDDPKGAGVTVADGSSIFAVQFQAIGVAGSSSTIEIVDSPTIRETTVNFTPAEMNSLPGRVTIGNTVEPPDNARPELNLSLTQGLKLSGAVGSRYRIEYREDLSSGTTWNPLMTVVLKEVSELIPAQQVIGITNRYYRAVLVP
jgi:hypothetical protein